MSDGEWEPFEIAGFRVGHWTHPTGATGCTVIVADAPALAVADVRGGAPGTREVALLEQGRLVQRVDAVLLTGGSAFGLAAADGVVAWLREHGRGFPTSSIPVPIVAGAVIFDLDGPTPPLPTADSGYEAAANAVPHGWISGRVGAGSGATAGKLAGRARATPTGIGSTYVQTELGALGALFVVNPYGDVVDPETGQILAGTRGDAPGTWADTERAILRGGSSDEDSAFNTVIGVVAIDGEMDRDALVRVAVAAHDGIARAVRPAHTLFDGDVVFVLARREGSPPDNAVLTWCTAAQRAVAEAIVRSVRRPEGQG
ncbi:P1 family peptidase [Sphaerobacter thermophilus]|uniref:Peptidase S58 DmpA n=1 Tax=Sphaerobacter thermophilus (strain ATCC 49802 / DSM 20745 / KCCM 41009 / NCIMB 13125 / S 6022) TaxID=479434 RepID=D1C2N9_SPHTD|nr:P1 family peptidase [Sphaerobacter thermophilus]ACZ38506.1 peptidase S58 DmpA [Sphaerobacter thermophilus DSM 20745]